MTNTKELKKLAEEIRQEQDCVAAIKDDLKQAQKRLEGLLEKLVHDAENGSQQTIGDEP